MAEKTQSSHIVATMTIEAIFSHFPHKAQRLAQELSNAGLHCVGCGAATWETLEAGCLTHGMSFDMIEGLIRRLNAILDEEIDLSTITLTPRAATKYLQILEDEDKSGWGLRLLEQPGGCGGYEYVLDFSQESKETDEVFESQGIEIHIDKPLVQHLLGCEIDYIDGLRGSGFKVSNPNVSAACACGSSHSY